MIVDEVSRNEFVAAGDISDTAATIVAISANLDRPRAGSLKRS